MEKFKKVLKYAEKKVFNDLGEDFAHGIIDEAVMSKEGDWLEVDQMPKRIATNKLGPARFIFGDLWLAIRVICQWKEEKEYGVMFIEYRYSYDHPNGGGNGYRRRFDYRFDDLDIEEKQLRVIL